MHFDPAIGILVMVGTFLLVREHCCVPDYIAIVDDKAWQKMAGKIMAKFVNAEARFYDSGDYDGAVAWVAA